MQRAGDFSETLNAQGRQIVIYDPSTTRLVNGVNVRDPFPGIAFRPRQLDPVALKLMQFYPLPNRAPDNVTGANNFRANYVSSAQTQTSIWRRWTTVLGDNDKLTGRYFFNGGPTRNSSVYPIRPPTHPRRRGQCQHYVYGSWTRTLNATLVNDLRFTYIRRSFHAISATGWAAITQ